MENKPEIIFSTNVKCQIFLVFYTVFDKENNVFFHSFSKTLKYNLSNT